VSVLPVFVLLIGISNVLDSDTRLLGVIALVVGAVATYRAARTASVVIDDTGVVIREFLRTRRIDYHDVTRAATNDELDHAIRGVNAALAPRADGAHLVLYLTNGNVVRARSLRNSNAGGALASCRVERAADAVNAHIRQTTPGTTT
jgi:hypothetical protein